MFFDLCRTENGKISVGAFLEELSRFGILSDDPRLEPMMFLLNKLKPNSALTVRELKLEPQAFKAVLSEHIMLINKALQNSFIIADFEGFCHDIANIYNKVG